MLWGLSREEIFRRTAVSRKNAPLFGGKALAALKTGSPPPPRIADKVPARVHDMAILTPTVRTGRPEMAPFTGHTSGSPLAESSDPIGQRL